MFVHSSFFVAVLSIVILKQWVWYQGCWMQVAILLLCEI